VALLQLILTTNSQNTRNQLIHMHVCYATDQFSMQLYLPDFFFYTSVSTGSETVPLVFYHRSRSISSSYCALW